MKAYILFFLLIAMTIPSCSKDELITDNPNCIQKKIDDFIGKDTSFSITRTKEEGKYIYKFSNAIEDLYLDENCSTLCQFSMISCVMTECVIEMMNLPDWETVWEK
jgi:hypothetical protein